MKDRMALSIIEGAEKRGELKPGGRVVEYTGGSTGSSLSMVCAAKGYGAYMVSSDAFTEEKIRTMMAGTGGCFSGVAEILKGNCADVKCFAGEPDAHRNISGGAIGGHRIEGIGIGFLPKIMRLDLADKVVSVKDDDAYETARALAREEGILGGISSGANVFAALQLARELGPGKRVVTVIVDSGLKYFQKDLFTN